MLPSDPVHGAPLLVSGNTVRYADGCTRLYPTYDQRTGWIVKDQIGQYRVETPGNGGWEMSMASLIGVAYHSGEPGESWEDGISRGRMYLTFTPNLIGLHSAPGLRLKSSWHWAPSLRIEPATQNTGQLVIRSFMPTGPMNLAWWLSQKVPAAMLDLNPWYNPYHDYPITPPGSSEAPHDEEQAWSGQNANKWTPIIPMPAGLLTMPCFTLELSLSDEAIDPEPRSGRVINFYSRHCDWYNQGYSAPYIECWPEAM